VFSFGLYTNAPEQLSAQDVANIFGTFTRHFLNLSAISLGLGFFSMGRLFSLISDDMNSLELFTVGVIFSFLVGSILGYMIGPALYFVVTEITFIMGSMIGIGFLIHLVSKEKPHGNETAPQHTLSRNFAP
jgi:hypothetical protein